MREPIRPTGGRRPTWLLPAAIVAGILAVAVGAVIGLAGSGSRDVGQGEPSAAPTATAKVATVSSSAEPTNTPASTPDPTPVAPLVVPNLAIAAITVDALAVWSEPSEASIQFGELGKGARLFVIGEPSEQAGRRWYRIAYVDGPRVSGFDLGPCQLNCGPSLGYIATPASGDDAWLEVVDVECPASPMTTDQLSSLLWLERLHCYGPSDITVTGTVQAPPDGVTPSGAFLPTWLADNAPRFAGGLGIHFSPMYDGELPDPLATVRMVGHFEDDAAPTCSIDFTRIFDGPSVAFVVLSCRATFVVTEVEVLAAP